MPCALRGRTVRIEGSDVMRLMKRVYRNSTRSTSCRDQWDREGRREGERGNEWVRVHKNEFSSEAGGIWGCQKRETALREHSQQVLRDHR